MRAIERLPGFAPELMAAAKHGEPAVRRKLREIKDDLRRTAGEALALLATEGLAQEAAGGELVDIAENLPWTGPECHETAWMRLAAWLANALRKSRSCRAPKRDICAISRPWRSNAKGRIPPRSGHRCKPALSPSFQREIRRQSVFSTSKPSVSGMTISRRITSSEAKATLLER